MARIIPFHENLFEDFDLFKEISLYRRRFKHADLLPLIKKLPFEKMVLGQSFEGREIIKIAYGNGPINILMWSQMHGNEATATMAIMDIFNFLNTYLPKYEKFKKVISEQFTVHFIPMLNPDGAERFQRRTAQGIDMNRDALALRCPESKILKDVVSKLNPMFSFNLHDQGVRWGAGSTGKQATIAFLATAYNEAREWNEVRTRARQVISVLNDTLQKYIPDRVARFSDEFEPRAFGDNIQKWGSSLILIESGGYNYDFEKQYIRKLNFVTILSALETIATQSYLQKNLDEYLNIPPNDKALFDLKIINATYILNGKSYSVDLGLNYDEKNNSKATNFKYTSVIEDMGDLSVFYGIKTIDAKGAIIKSFYEFPELLKKHKPSNAPKSIEIKETASFVLDHPKGKTIIVDAIIVA